jgi:hypothetical protein
MVLQKIDQITVSGRPDELYNKSKSTERRKIVADNDRDYRRLVPFARRENASFWTLRKSWIPAVRQLRMSFRGLRDYDIHAARMA